MPNFTIETNFKGINGAKAYHTALTLIRSLWHIPFATPHSKFEDMCNWFDELPDESDNPDEATKRKMLKLAVNDGVMLEEKEIESLLIFAKDQNNIPCGKEIIKNLTAFEINDLILDVVCEIFKQKVFFYRKNK